MYIRMYNSLLLDLFVLLCFLCIEFVFYFNYKSESLNINIICLWIFKINFVNDVCEVL